MRLISLRGTRSLLRNSVDHVFHKRKTGCSFVQDNTDDFQWRFESISRIVESSCVFNQNPSSQHVACRNGDGCDHGTTAYY